MRYEPHPNVVARHLDDVIVLVHLDTSRIFTLNPTGTRIWELLTGPARDQDVGALEQMLREQYEVDDERLHGEIMDLLGQMEDERLVVGADRDKP
jgi:hypothetical protein